ncbi:MAG TPA: hypothetical protein VJC17_03925 [Candidatus Dojkabacteria bacterium]|nr:hypothetical protein [Candidatus Dojkabacteria bacterium]
MDPLEAIQTLEQTQDPSVDPLQNFDPSLPFAFGFVGAVGLFLLTGYFINSYLKNKKAGEINYPLIRIMALGSVLLGAVGGCVVGALLNR